MTTSLLLPFVLMSIHAQAKSEAPVTPLVQTFQIQPYTETQIPKATASFKAERLAARIKDQDVIRISRVNGPAKGPAIVGVDVARGAGLAPLAWTVKLPDGQTFNLTGAADAATIEKAYEADSKNQFRDNLFFQNGIVASLYPFANRLTGASTDGLVLHTKVSGQTVAMPLNNKAATPDAIPHHLHGLIFGDLAKVPSSGPMVDVTNSSARVTGEFQVDSPWWTGQTVVTTTAELTDNGYVYHMKVKNTGHTPVPVGAGSHPYFASPISSRDAIKVHVPAKSLVEINNLNDVLPTGRIIPIAKSDPALDFTNPSGTRLHAAEIKNNSTGSRFDNLWVDLEKDANGFAYAEVFFPLSHFKVRMTALTKNVIGIQGYAPKFKDGQKTFVALELVTNLPDPREELWKKTPTGMTVLKPGETFEYGYKIEVSPL